ncbi:DMT family transporter [Priestia taiwanensis]|uniref:Transporter n=1 Tax=Priestia taiwanensis TaxID=1347902 RepID=A0A917ALV7_9BACI|nr:EamA family transporter [Priestia taiwanensis]MBM7362318.1 drug/metabolite transporter (DMT)-like permease [Priestia taiwanensis]GGE61195.1 transporter [Priestia taiwanensis]
MKTKDIAALFGLAALWGASFLFMRIASPAIGPFLTTQGRVTIAAIALLIYIIIIKKSTEWRQRWKQYLIIGALNAAIPFTLISTASLHLNASIMAIINSMTPLFTALIVWLWLKEKLGVRKWIGIMVGIIGVLFLVGWSPISFTPEVIIAIILCILSTVFYGIGGVYAKKAFNGVQPLLVAFGQQIGASFLLIPFTLFHLPTSASTITPTVVWSVVCLALLCTAIGYLLYFYLITSVGPTKALSVTFLVPLFGMIWGVVFLNEQINIGMIAGLMVILISIFLISDIRINAKSSHKKMGDT